MFECETHHYPDGCATPQRGGGYLNRLGSHTGGPSWSIPSRTALTPRSPCLPWAQAQRHRICGAAPGSVCRVGELSGGVMIIGVVQEARPGETRVAATPTTVAQLIKLGYDVVVDAGGGSTSSFPDEMYVEAGATIEDARRADIVLGVNPPS